MIKIKEIIQYIESWAPRAVAWENDNVGLQVGYHESETNTVMIALEVTPDVINQAIDYGCNFIITHHPLIFKPLKFINPDTYTGMLVTELVKNDINLYSAHTNLDFAPGGVSIVLAETLGLQDIKFLIKRSVDLDRSTEGIRENEFGAGAVGIYRTPVKTDELIMTIKNKLHIPVVRWSPGSHDAIKTVAVCGGSGSNLLYEAIANNADAFITSDVRYHTFQEARGKIYLFDAGHYETENLIVEKIADNLKQEFGGRDLKIIKSKIDTNPVIYT